ncbi:MAG TPA: cation:proton antiporter [Terriglobales bacterium]|nr:cation:proton antiporter [Terriglobales bacterium]
MNIGQLIPSIGTILFAARVFGWAFQRIGQPRIVGEMTAGIVLGPSLFGRVLPDVFAFVFPSSSMPAITVLSQLGLLLFMFVVGLEVDLKRILQQRSAVVLIGLGVLMNTRGLFELVILNAGLDLGILLPPLFTMMVLMALTTTFMTSPLPGAMKIQRDCRAIAS